MISLPLAEKAWKLCLAIAGHPWAKRQLFKRDEMGINLQVEHLTHRIISFL
jgi:hypothetical protein